MPFLEAFEGTLIELSKSTHLVKDIASIFSGNLT